MVKRVEIVLIVVIVLAVALVVLVTLRSGAVGGRVSAEPADVVDAGGDWLASLKPGMLVRHRDEQLIVERTLHFADGDEQWVEHRLADDRLGRSLWLEVQRRDGLEIVVYERLPSGEEPPGGAELARDGMTFRFSERGAARYRSDERAGPPKRGSVEFVEFAAGRLRLAYERFDAGPWEVSLGHQVEPADIEIA
jgi:Domain of unknown function (DUF4178)